MMSTTSAVNNVNRVNDVNHVQKSDAARRRCKTRASERRWWGEWFFDVIDVIDMIDSIDSGRH
jgi:hypothetical protein